MSARFDVLRLTLRAAARGVCARCATGWRQQVKSRSPAPLSCRRQRGLRHPPRSSPRVPHGPLRQRSGQAAGELCTVHPAPAPSQRGKPFPCAPSRTRAVATAPYSAQRPPGASPPSSTALSPSSRTPIRRAARWSRLTVATTPGPAARGSRPRRASSIPSVSPAPHPSGPPTAPPTPRARAPGACWCHQCAPTARRRRAAPRSPHPLPPSSRGAVQPGARHGISPRAGQDRASWRWPVRPHFLHRPHASPVRPSPPHSPPPPLTHPPPLRTHKCRFQNWLLKYGPPNFPSFRNVWQSETFPG